MFPITVIENSVFISFTIVIIKKQGNLFSYSNYYVCNWPQLADLDIYINKDLN
jgi:hypothetical protein